jgi:hypothetical protein
MALLKSTQVTRSQPVPNADRAIELIPIFADYTLTGSEASADVLEMLPLPPGCAVVDVILDTDDLAGTTFTANVGLLTGEYGAGGARTCGAEFMSAKALGAAAAIFRADVAGYTRIAPSGTTRSIGLALTTVTGPTAGAKVRLTALVRPAVEAV